MRKVTPLFFIFFLISLSSSNPDFETLLSFKASSDRSHSLSSWSNSTHPCSWLGVTCNPNSTQVTQLVLENLNLTGSIQALTHLTHLRLLSLKHNNLFSSPTCLDISLLKNLKLLYLSHNLFSATFPSGITQLHRLRRLDLSHNQFSGEIPLTPLTQLPHLLTLRLESNSFNGVLLISSKFDSLETLVEFNVSNNNLSGEIPKPLSLFPSSSFRGNEKLCGKPLLYKCLNHTIQIDPIPVDLPTRHVTKKFSGRSILVILLVDLCAVILLGIVIFVCCLKFMRRNPSLGMKKKELEVKRRNGYEKEEMVFFEGSKHFKVEELLKASAEMLGKGSVGSTYKVAMDNGDIVVVKRVKETRRKKKEIAGLLKEIGGLRHCNIVSLRAYYYSGDELLLVYDFLPNGSLDSLLHGNRGPGRTPLDWKTRFRLAVGVAEGLMFLHDASKSKLSHGHLTSSNVVIDQEGKACISDIGLHQLFQIQTLCNTEYKAPSTHSSRRFSQRNDVYSFGVILLEMLTGKMEGSLVSWVQSVGRDKWVSEVFDFELLAHKEREEEMVALLQVALLCLTPVSHERPKINVVHKMIKDIGRDGD